MERSQFYKTPDIINPVLDFVQDFHLSYNKFGVVHFEATINYKVEDSVFKMQQTKVRIKDSGSKPMDIIGLINPDIDITLFPTTFFIPSDAVSYMPNQFLIIKGNRAPYGDYSVIVFPKCIYGAVGIS